MSNLDNLVKRLRARVLRSAQRERSLDWMSAEAIETLQAQNVRLRDELDAFLHERDKRMKAQKLEEKRGKGDSSGLGDPLEHEHPALSMRPALGLKEAAALLSVSYSTVYTHREALGFFQIGNQWRIWPATLREMTERSMADKSASPPSSACVPTAATRQSRSDVSGATHLAAVEKELDELLASTARKNRSTKRRPPRKST